MYMAKCLFCKKEGLFLRIDSRGLCKKCAEMVDTAKEKRRHMLDIDFPAAKEYLTKALLTEAQSYRDIKEGSHIVNNALAKHAVYSQNTILDNNAYSALLAFVTGDNPRKDEILQSVRTSSQIVDKEDYIDFLAGMLYDLDKVKAKYERLSSGVNNL